MDYDELTLNPALAEMESVVTATETDAKCKTRRIWTPKEEERFFVIWGRENWHLTRYGKNMMHFIKWADEMNEQEGSDMKPEEIQMKVNQTKAKYRQVSKLMEQEKTNVTRWKKFALIDKILRNEHRPIDADPISPEAMEKSREFSTLHSTPYHQLQAEAEGSGNSMGAPAAPQTQDGSMHSQDLNASPDQLALNPGEVGEPLNPSLFNSSDSQRTTSAYSTELFSDPIEEIKQEDFADDYAAFEMQEVQHTYGNIRPQQQLTQLQTPKQQQQQQQQQQLYQQQQQYQNVAPQTSQQQQLQHMQQQHPQQQSATTYATYTNNNNGSNNLPTPPQNTQHAPSLPPTATPPHMLHNQQTHAYNNSNNGNNNAAQHYGNSNYVADAAVDNSNSNQNTTTTNNMQPPQRTVNATPTRKRRAPAAAATAANEQLDTLYLEEVRKKNVLLEEQKEISRKRMLLEERKVALMEQFFPKCLELQQQILQKLDTTTTATTTTTPT